jgi:microcystin degradation protein MlrC
LRIAVGEISQESGTFLPAASDLERFRRGVLSFGDEMLPELEAGSRELGGAARALRRRGAELVPTLAALAFAWGPLTPETSEFFRKELSSRLREAGELDGVLLVLHGALAAEGEDDVDGLLLATARSVVGRGVPIAATLDCHANVTARMIANADVLVAYATVPHVDQAETGARAAELLADAAAGRTRPAMRFRKLPMITPAEKHDTSKPPMRTLAEARRATESLDGVLSCSICYAQPWLDVPELGWATLVVTDGDPQLAQRHADELARLAWRDRRSFLVEKAAPADAVAYCLAAKEGPIVVSDSGDSPGGGGGGDSTTLLAALLEADPRPSALLAIADANAAKAAAGAGVGAEVELRVGAGVDTVASRPVHIRGRVRGTPFGKLRITGPSWQDAPVDLGVTAVVDVDEVTIVISEHGLYSIDPDLFRQLGVDPAAYRVVQARSEVAFRAAYEGLAKDVVLMRSPGFTTSDFETLDWRRAPRPLFPLDEIDDDWAEQLETRGTG